MHYGVKVTLLPRSKKAWVQIHLGGEFVCPPRVCLGFLLQSKHFLLLGWVNLGF